MKWLVLGCAVLLAGCAYAPPVDNPSAPEAMDSDAGEMAEAQQLEQAEAECARDGKHAEAQRVDGDVVYDCVASED